jgi:hypothetical protein
MFTLSKLMAGLAIPSWNGVAAARTTYQRSQCDASTLNTTIGTYTVAQYDTIFTIAANNQRGVRDIARANRMAHATIINVGEELIIPAQVCHPDEKNLSLRRRTSDARLHPRRTTHLHNLPPTTQSSASR